MEINETEGPMINEGLARLARAQSFKLKNVYLYNKSENN